jgi:hypothetical protein
MPPNHILDNVLDAIGNTPLIRLDKIARAEGLRCNLCKIRTPVSPRIALVTRIQWES